MGTTPATSLALVGFAIAVLVGFGLLAWGLRPPRRGDEPRCLRCNYNLTGLTSERCPECGSPLTSETTVRGISRRRPVLIVIGILLLLASPAPPLVAGIDWYRHWPADWLIDDVSSRSGNVWFRAWSELMRREAGGSLTDAQHGRLVDACLAEQKKHPKVASIPMVEYLGAQVAGGSLPEKKVEQFLQQAITLDLRVRKRVAAGGCVAFEFSWLERAPTRAAIWVQCEFGDIQVDGRPCQMEADSWDPWRHACALFWGRVRTAVTECRMAGHHVLSSSAVVQLWRGPYDDEANSVLLREWTVTPTAEFEAVDQAPSELVRAIHAPELVERLRSEIRIDEATCSPRWLRLTFGFPANLPVPVAFDVIVRDSEGERKIDPIVVPAGMDACTPGIMGFLGGAGCPDPTVTVILRGSAEAALHTVDVQEYWDGELVFKDVPVPPDRDDVAARSPD